MGLAAGGKLPCQAKAVSAALRKLGMAGWLAKLPVKETQLLRAEYLVTKFCLSGLIITEQKNSLGWVPVRPRGNSTEHRGAALTLRRESSIPPSR